VRRFGWKPESRSALARPAILVGWVHALSARITHSSIFTTDGLLMHVPPAGEEESRGTCVREKARWAYTSIYMGVAHHTRECLPPPRQDTAENSGRGRSLLSVLSTTSPAAPAENWPSLVITLSYQEARGLKLETTACSCIKTKNGRSPRAVCTTS
jgi:hypothetical protein